MFIIRLVNLFWWRISVIIFLSQMTLLRSTFLLRLITGTITALLFWIISFFWTFSLLYSTFPFVGKFWSCIFLSFHWIILKCKIRYDTSLCSIWLHIYTYDYSPVDWDGLRDHLRDDLNLVLLWLLWNFVFGFRLELMLISLILNILSNFIYLHSF